MAVPPFVAAAVAVALAFPTATAVALLLPPLLDTDVALADAPKAIEPNINITVAVFIIGVLMADPPDYQAVSFSRPPAGTVPTVESLYQLRHLFQTVV
jgi:hypothetical protein